MSDLVTRLRDCWCADSFVVRGLVDPACDHDGVRSEAADEIERLRADRDKWYHLARRLYAQHGKRSSEVMELAHVLAIYEQESAL